MRSHLITLLIAFSLISCSTDDNEIDCSLQTFPVNVFYLEIIDNAGNNLLSNQTYDPEQIEVTINDVVVSNVTQIEGEPVIVISFSEIQSPSPGNYQVILSEDEIDEMQMEYTEEKLPCRTIYTVQKVIYNGEELEVESEEYIQKVVIVK